MEVGKSFLHFVVLRQIGKGGMGDVYLAEDQKLGRKVALKFLPQEFVQNADRLRRFEQEARAASALNHPNIMTIFEVGESDGHHFIASEYIEGETLRERITSSAPFSVQQAVEIAIQITAALAAAHAAKIVHRDIKPENIMIRQDGYVKVLDFGLAKQQDPASSNDPASIFPTKAFAQTEPGTVLGTIQYMSPEQARGLDLDWRTDLFSVGVILYEMIAGRIPFDGATRSDVIVSILKQEPEQLSSHAPEVRPELEWIVSKALRKDREERYQTAKELMGDLKTFQQRSGIHGSSSITTESRRSGSAPAASVTATTSSAEYIVSGIKKHKGAAAMIVLLALAAVVFIWKGLRTSGSATVTDPSLKISRLTTSGTVGNAAISPDGKLVVYSMQMSGQQGLWLKQIATGSNIPIVPLADVEYIGLSFSPDGNYIYFARSEKGSQSNALYRAPVLGGSATKVLDDIDSSVAISPDGKRIAFVRFQSGGISRLLTAGIDGSSIKTQFEARSPEVVYSKNIEWSRDGNKILFSGARADELLSIYETVVDSGKKRVVSRNDWGDVDGIAWANEGNDLMISAAHVSTNWFYQIWSITYPGGVPRRVTKDPNNYVGLSATADSKSFVTVQNERLSDIWIVTGDGTSPAKQITYERYDGRSGLSWTPESKILFGDRNFDLWLMDPDGSNRKILTTDEHSNRNPLVTPDGKYVIFESWRKSALGSSCGLWIMTAEGTNPKWLARTQCSVTATCAGNCSSILFDQSALGSGIWSVSASGGNPVQIIKDETYRPAFSPNGSKIACLLIDRSVSEIPVIAIYPAEGGSRQKVFQTTQYLNPRLLRWTPDGSGIVYINNKEGVSNLWLQPVDGGAARQITNFDADQILSFDWSKDGKIAVARGKSQNDVMLITTGD